MRNIIFFLLFSQMRLKGEKIGEEGEEERKCGDKIR
jgi:hypothetical protein